MDAWARLFETAFRVHAMAPWKWMEETDIFGIQPPGATEPAFVSVMGAIGEHFAVAVYPSVAALRQFWEIQLTSRDYQRPDLILETPQVQVIFGAAADLHTAEKKIIKALGRAPRGGNAWPRFRGYRPDYMPWFIEPGEDVLLLTALQQLLEFAPMVEQDPTPLSDRIGPDLPVLVRTPAGSDPTSAWQNDHRSFSAEPVHLRVAIPEEMRDAFRRLSRTDLRVEVDAPIVPARIGGPGEGPSCPICSWPRIPPRISPSALN